MCLRLYVHVRWGGKGSKQVSAWVQLFKLFFHLTLFLSYSRFSLMGGNWSINPLMCPLPSTEAEGAQVMFHWLF